jgi:ABC-2 type transport system permease protein
MRAVAKLTWIEIKLFLRDPVTVVFALILPIIFLFVLAEVFTSSPSVGLYRGARPIDFYVTAYIGIAMAAVGLISVPAQLAGYREAGVLRRFRASSIPRWVIFASQMIFALIVVAITGTLMVIATALVYGLEKPESIGACAIAISLGALCVIVLGLCLGTLLPSARAAQLAGMILFFLSLLLSGAGPPPELLGDGLNTVANLLPLTHVIRLIQDPWLGSGWNNTAMSIVLGITFVSAGLMMLFSRSE